MFLCLVLVIVGGLVYGSRQSPGTLTAGGHVGVIPYPAGAPFGVGNSAGNIRLDSRALVAVRWVARHDGTITRLWLKTRTITHGGAADSSYFHGTTGVWRANTYTTTRAGRPDPRHLLASERFVPVRRMMTDSLSQGVRLGEVIGLHLDLPTAEGKEYITTFENVGHKPSVNYASLNFLYSSSGLQGAQSRNDRSPVARDALYGLDPREIVGGRVKAKWYLPGNNYGAFDKFLPTFVEQYADGTTAGQPYYSGHSLRAGEPVTERYVLGGDQTILGVGAFLTAADRLVARLSVDGARPVSISLAGRADQFVSATLSRPLKVIAGSIIEITATPHVTGSLKSLYADEVFEQLMGLGPRYRWGFTSLPARTVPLYPLYPSVPVAAGGAPR